MLTIIHGDDIVASRKYFIDLKFKHPEGTSIDGQDVTLTTLAQTLEGGGLFTEEKTLFIEQLFSKKKTSSDFKSIISYLSNPSHLSANIFLWENKELEKSTTASLKNASIKVFKLPQSLFIFLDSIKPKNGQVLVKLFHQTISTMEVEMIFAMLIRQFRLLLALQPKSHTPHPNLLPKGEGTVISPSPEGEGRGEGYVAIEEIKRLQPWQKDKLQKQSSHFSFQQLIVIYRELFELEKSQKTGILPTNLTNAIDILLLGI